MSLAIGFVPRMLPNLKLEPEGGPGCSSRISSSDRNVELQTGVELILMMYGVR
jgi:hypothetical protein